MKLKLALLAFFTLCANSVYSQTLDITDQSVVGYYKLGSLNIKSKEDYEKKEKYSREYFEEMTACQKDQTLEIRADHTATYSVGAIAENCKKDVTEYKWEIANLSREEEERVNGKRVTKTITKTFLILTDSHDNVERLELKMVSTWNIKFKHLVSGISDSGEMGIYNFKKVKKEN
jgi:hypothetical protein